MWRAFFLSVGVCAMVLGIESLVIEKVVMAASGEHSTSGLAERVAPSALREVEPPEWAPWSLMSGGAVIILYTFTIPQKIKS
jgi:hypothetical protein